MRGKALHPRKLTANASKGDFVTGSDRSAVLGATSLKAVTTPAGRAEVSGEEGLCHADAPIQLGEQRVHGASTVSHRMNVVEHVPEQKIAPDYECEEQRKHSARVRSGTVSVNAPRVPVRWQHARSSPSPPATRHPTLSAHLLESREASVILSSIVGSAFRPARWVAI
jgi:hypothetical protein